jgi:hypothetical protein
MQFRLGDLQAGGLQRAAFDAFSDSPLAVTGHVTRYYDESYS